MQGLLTPQPLRITEVYDDGEASRHFTFEFLGPGVAQAILPGHFFALTVPQQGEAAFTYLSLPDAAGRFHALVRRMGNLTTALFACGVGDVLGYRGPFGSGLWPIEELKGRRVLVVAGGCGLAPLATAIEALLADGSGKVALIYGNQTPHTQVLQRELADWRRRLPVLETFDQSVPAGACGGTPLDHIDAILPRLGGEPEAVLTCGPEVMMEATARLFMRRGLAADRIWLALERRMHCGVGLCGHCYIASSYVCMDGPIYRWDRLQALHGQTTAGCRSRTL